MKRFLLIAGLLLGAICQTLQAQAVIQFEKTSHDFGTFSSDQPQKCEFLFTNTGDSAGILLLWLHCSQLYAYTDQSGRKGESHNKL